MYSWLSLVSVWKICTREWEYCRQAYLLCFATSFLRKFQISSFELLLISICLVLLLLLLLLVFWEHWVTLLLGTGRKDLTLDTPNSVFDLLLLHSVVWWLLRGLTSFCDTGILGLLAAAENPGLFPEQLNLFKSYLESAILLMSDSDLLEHILWSSLTRSISSSEHRESLWSNVNDKSFSKDFCFDREVFLLQFSCDMVLFLMPSWLTSGLFQMGEEKWSDFLRGLVLTFLHAPLSVFFLATAIVTGHYG